MIVTRSLVILLVVTLNVAPCLSSAEDQVPLKKPSATELLAGMRLRAAATKVVQVAKGQRIVGQASAQPLFRFSDEPRDILDATLWAYGKPGGRPVALQKVEVYHRPEGLSWFYCMTSLSEALVESEWRDGQTWASKKPGIDFRRLPQGPKPAATGVQRLFQMKQIVRRFQATLFDANADQRVVMRPLPRPIYRYADPSQGIQDGAIFGYTTAGTNPDALLSIELQGNNDADLVWKYGLVRITLCDLTVALDEKPIWHVGYVLPQGPGHPSKFDTWLFFHESPVN